MREELLDYLAYKNTPRLPTAITLNEDQSRFLDAQRVAATEAVNRVLGVVWRIAIAPRTKGAAVSIRSELAALCHLGSSAHAGLTEQQMAIAIKTNRARICDGIGRVRKRYMHGVEIRPKVGQGSWQR